MSNYTYVILKFSRTKEVREIEEIVFELNKRVVIEYSPLIEQYFEVDIPSRRIKTEQVDIGFARLDNKIEGQYGLVIGKKNFMKLLMYCAVNCTYDCALREVDEMETIAEIIKELY